MKPITNKINLLTRILGVTFSIVFLFSCETEEYAPESFNADFDVPSTIVAGEQFQLQAFIDGPASNTEWVISDGSVYATADITHTFIQPGSYSITLNNYIDSKLQSSIEKKVEVLSGGTLLQTKGVLQAIDANYENGNVVLRALNTTEDESSAEILYTLDDNLNVIEQEIISSIRNNNAAKVDDEPSYTLLNDFELIGSESGIVSGAALAYNSGYINVNIGASGEMLVDYYNDSNEKLWTKSFNNSSFTGPKYIGKLNNRLFYFSFSQEMDSLYIEKFSNPSVVYNRLTIDISKFTTSSELLFAFVNPTTEQMYFGVYDNQNDNSFVFSMNEDCNLDISAIIDGVFNGQLQSIISDGSMVIKNGAELTNYSTSWDLSSTKKVGVSDFGICQLGDNLSVLYKNLPDGTIQISYIDKHFNTVIY